MVRSRGDNQLGDTQLDNGGGGDADYCDADGWGCLSILTGK